MLSPLDEIQEIIEQMSDEGQHINERAAKLEEIARRLLSARMALLLNLTRSVELLTNGDRASVAEALALIRTAAERLKGQNIWRET